MCMSLFEVVTAEIVISYQSKHVWTYFTTENNVVSGWTYCSTKCCYNQSTAETLQFLPFRAWG